MPNGQQKQSGIMPRRYKSGSIIYFEGDKSDSIYILKQGRVVLTLKKVEKGEIIETKESIKPGEFFGVKSSLGKYPRDETAQTIGETVVLVLSSGDFERLILKNLKIVKKMLQVFSNQLRRIGRMVREVLGEGGTINPEMELFKIGEHYYKMGKYKQAHYAYKKYMDYYPDTKYSRIASKRISSIDAGTAESDFSPGVDFEAEDAISSEASPIGGADMDMTDFSADDTDMASGSGAEDTLGDLGSGMDDFSDPGESTPKSAISSEMDDFLSEESNDSGDLDSFSFDEPGSEDPGKM